MHRRTIFLASLVACLPCLPSLAACSSPQHPEQSLIPDDDDASLGDPDGGFTLDGGALDSGRSLDGGADAVAADTRGPVDANADDAPITTASASACDVPLFIDAIASWTEVTVSGGGMDAIRTAISSSNLAKPTRITVRAGTYKGACLYVEDHLRTATAPLWIRADGLVQIDCTDGNGQAVDFHHSSYIAFDGFTIGPASGHYGDSAVHIDGAPVSPSDPAHYGEYSPAHHIIVRNLTARNLNRGSDGDSNPDAYESGCCDAVKSNQAEYVWVLGSTISRTARHGLDNVGVHHAYFCDNVLTDMVGAGFGMEAKGGSSDILFERNSLRRVRRRAIVLGGEGTDNVFMWPWNAKYEGQGVIARNNVIVDAAEGGLGFYGCQGCTAIGNSVWVSAGYATGPRDMLDLAESILEGAGDYWGGSRRVGEVIHNGDNRVLDNLFGVATSDMGCALEATARGVEGLHLSHNFWWNGGAALPECGEGTTSITGYPDATSTFATKDPRITTAGTPSVAPVLRPRADSPLIGAGIADATLVGPDFTKKPRPTTPTIGALEP